MADMIRARRLEKKRGTANGNDHLTPAELDKILDDIAPLRRDLEKDSTESEPQPVPQPNPVQAAPQRQPSEPFRELREMIFLKREKALLERELLALTRIVAEIETLEPASRVSVLARIQRAHA